MDFKDYLPGNCDKCGEEVPAGNDVVALEYVRSGNATIFFSQKPRHLLPVTRGKRVVCQGSPSRAQHLPGQSHDTRSTADNDPAYAESIRQAYARLQELTA